MLFIYFVFLRNYFLRELGDAEFILRELGGAEFIFCENWVAQNLFLRELGGAEFIFSNWLPTPYWVAFGLF